MLVTPPLTQLTYMGTDMTANLQIWNNQGRLLLDGSNMLMSVLSHHTFKSLDSLTGDPHTEEYMIDALGNSLYVYPSDIALKRPSGKPQEMLFYGLADNQTVYAPNSTGNIDPSNVSGISGLFTFTSLPTGKLIKVGPLPANKTSGMFDIFDAGGNLSFSLLGMDSALKMISMVKVNSNVTSVSGDYAPTSYKVPDGIDLNKVYFGFSGGGFMGMSSSPWGTDIFAYGMCVTRKGSTLYFRPVTWLYVELLRQWLDSTSNGSYATNLIGSPGFLNVLIAYVE